MPKIISVGTAVPPYKIAQNDAREFAFRMFSHHFKDIHRLMKIFENTQIDQRYFCVPVDWFDHEHSFEEKNAIYTKNAIELSKNAIYTCLSKTSYSTKDIDHIIFVSSTGISAPSIDAYLFNDPELDFSPHIKRTPIWGLGCAGGAAGISRAFDYTTAFPNEKVLVIAVEIGELAFLKDDFSKSNLVATSLFGDGAAAVLVIGDHIKETNDSKLAIIDSQSTIWKNSLDVMGWDVQNRGLKVIFSKDIPSIIAKDLKPSFDQFLEKHQLNYSDIQFYILHPGGTKVIEAYEKTFAIDESKTASARNVLKNYGNMSSPTVLFTLKEVLDYHQDSIRGFGIMLALGPGFSSEIILLQDK